MSPSSSQESKSQRKWSLHCLPLLLSVLSVLPGASAQISRTKPVVMPFAPSYGQYNFGSWPSVPITIGSQQLNLSLSNTLMRSWLPGKLLCDGDSNVTLCTDTLGGTFDDSVSGGTWKEKSKSLKVETELLEGIYNKTLSKNLYTGSGDSKKLLALEGVGNVGTDNLKLRANTGTFNLDSQSVGIITSANTKNMANGYLSLQQLALSLYANRITPSPSFHMYPGTQSNDPQILIFGGYDSTTLNLNTTYQYPLVKTAITDAAKEKDSDKNSTTAPLPDSDTVGFRMEVMIEDIIYRWTNGGATDNPLLSASTLAILDSTTPYLWLPKTTLQKLVEISGVTWNDTYNTYQIIQCFSTCNDAQSNAKRAVMDFYFEHMKGDKIILDFSYLDVIYLPYDRDLGTDRALHMLPVKELPDGSPIVLGRPFLSGVHLWVDYAEKWFGIGQRNMSMSYYNSYTPRVVSWDRTNHPPITNSSVLLVKTSEDISPGSSESSSGTSESSSGGNSSKDSSKKEGKPPLGIIIGIASGCTIMIISICLFIYIRFFRKPAPKPAPSDNDNSGSYELHNQSHRPEAMELPHRVQPSGAFGSKVYEVASSHSTYQRIPELASPAPTYYTPPVHSPPLGTAYGHSSPNPYPPHPPQSPHLQGGYIAPPVHEMDSMASSGAPQQQYSPQQQYPQQQYQPQQYQLQQYQPQRPY
jgi:hypothetical protein